MSKLRQKAEQLLRDEGLDEGAIRIWLPVLMEQMRDPDYRHCAVRTKEKDFDGGMPLHDDYSEESYP